MSSKLRENYISVEVNGQLIGFAKKYEITEHSKTRNSFILLDVCMSLHTVYELINRKFFNFNLIVEDSGNRIVYSHCNLDFENPSCVEIVNNKVEMIKLMSREKTETKQ